MMKVSATLASANQSVITLLSPSPILPPLNLPSEKTLPRRGQGDRFRSRFTGEDNSAQTCLADGPLTTTVEGVQPLIPKICSRS